MSFFPIFNLILNRISLRLTMSWYLYFAGGVACLLILLQKFKAIPCHPKEPPLIRQKIPYIGHLIGMLRDGSRYYTKMRHVFHVLEIYVTLTNTGVVMTSHSQSTPSRFQETKSTLLIRPNLLPQLIEIRKRYLSLHTWYSLPKDFWYQRQKDSRH